MEFRKKRDRPVPSADVTMARCGWELPATWWRGRAKGAVCPPVRRGHGCPACPGREGATPAGSGPGLQSKSSRGVMAPCCCDRAGLRELLFHKYGPGLSSGVPQAFPRKTPQMKGSHVQVTDSGRGRQRPLTCKQARHMAQVATGPASASRPCWRSSRSQGPSRF